MKYINNLDCLQKFDSLCDKRVSIIFELKTLKIYEFLGQEEIKLKAGIKFEDNVLESSFIYLMKRHKSSKTMYLQDEHDSSIIEAFSSCELVDILISANRVMINITHGINENFKEYSLIVNSKIFSIIN